MATMFLRAAWRNLLRHKVQTLINIASLAIGLSVFGFALLYVKQELSYDRWPEAERVHRLTLEQRGFPGLPDRSYAAALARSYVRLMDNFSTEFEAATRLVVWGAHIADEEGPDRSLWFVDPPFIEILQPQVLEGDLTRVVSGPGFIAVEETFARDAGLLGRVGERVTLAGFGQQEVEYELAAIYRLPRPVSAAANFPMFTLIHNYSLPIFDTGQGPRPGPWESQVQVWVKLREGLQTAAFNAQMPDYIQQNVIDYNETLGPERKVSDHLFYNWQPVRDLHFNPVSNEAFAGGGFGDMSRVITFAAVGLLVLLVGCSNSISLSLAAAIERRREIGVRKAAGALPSDIMWQRLGEAVLLTLLALAAAIAILELLLPAFQALLPFVDVAFGVSEYLLLAVIAVGVGLACGFYPALILSATRPQAVLRGGAQGSAKGSTRLRSMLVAIQFFFASLLLVGTAALYLQLAVARAQPLGFDASNTVFLYQNNGGASLEPLRTELEKVAGVARVIPGSNPPNAGIPPTANAFTLTRNIGDRNEVNVLVQFADAGFAELMGLRLLGGRYFDVSRDSPLAQAQGAQPGFAQRVLINASAARQLGFATPDAAVDQPLFNPRLNNVTGVITQIPLQIIGVVEDNLYASLRNRPGPELYFVQTRAPSQPLTSLIVKYEEAAETAIQQRIDETAERVLGGPLSSMLFAEPRMEAAFLQEQNESRLLLICSGLALLLASVGLFGLAAFTIERQIKEVGIRKTMGANVVSIVKLYLWRFGRPIVLSSLVAWPVAIYFVLQWIQRFPYQLDRAWLLPICIGTLATVLLIAMLTVSVITTRAATVNPVRSLRYE